MKDGLNYLQMVGHKRGIKVNGCFNGDERFSSIMAKALCNAIKNNNSKEEKLIASSFSNVEALNNAIIMLFCKHFRIEYDDIIDEFK